MSKWEKTRRDPGRTYLDEKKLERRKRMLARIAELVESGIEAEPEVAAAAKEADPAITPEKLQEVIMRFRDAVYERQQRDQRRR
jgi:hypothetical protein